MYDDRPTPDPGDEGMIRPSGPMPAGLTQDMSWQGVCHLLGRHVDYQYKELQQLRTELSELKSDLARKGVT